MYEAQKLYNKAIQNLEEWEIKKPETNEDMKEYIIKYDKKYNHIKSLFYEEYKKLHMCCPECGSLKYNKTLLGTILYLDKMNEYKDINKCICLECGNIHIYHDRVDILTV
jgi:hypothetical protein